MKTNKPTCRICFLDHVWYVAERWSEEEHNHLKGDTMLQGCWCVAVLVPVLLPLLARLPWACPISL